MGARGDRPGRGAETPPVPTAHSPSLCLEGFVESELKKSLSVQREARLGKVGNPEGRELLTQPDITLEEAGMVDGQVCPTQTHTKQYCPCFVLFLFVAQASLNM